jgi:hypothetical protein
VPGALHYIIIRGIERKPIFKDKIDYGNFIDRLGKILIDTITACFAWALITNHTPIFFLELAWFRIWPLPGRGEKFHERPYLQGLDSLHLPVTQATILAALRFLRSLHFGSAETLNRFMSSQHTVQNFIMQHYDFANLRPIKSVLP